LFSNTSLMKCFITLLLFFPATILSTDINAQSPSTIAASEIREKNNIPALAFAVVTADSILDSGVAGIRHIDAAKGTDTVYIEDYWHLGSNSKAITGFIAAWLVEQKKIKWDTKFFRLFPSWKEGSLPVYYQITLQDLLSHRAHIPAYTSGIEMKPVPDFTGSASQRRTDFAHYILKNKAAPKTAAFSYSNAGYTIAALMLEKASGKTWEELVKTVLSEKLHLRYFIGWPNNRSIWQPYGHWIENDTLKPLGPGHDYNLALIEPAGDISMPIMDYARFIQLNLQGLSGKDNFLKAATYQFLHKGIPDYSIGWGNYLVGEKDFSEHAGSAGTFYLYTIIDRKKGKAYIVGANAATPKTIEGIHELIKLLANKYGH
jgi:D-alanyl-D-alanine carboxypeptidase